MKKIINLLSDYGKVMCEVYVHSAHKKNEEVINHNLMNWGTIDFAESVLQDKN